MKQVLSQFKVTPLLVVRTLPAFTLTLTPFSLNCNCYLSVCVAWFTRGEITKGSNASRFRVKGI